MTTDEKLDQINEKLDKLLAMAPGKASAAPTSNGGGACLPNYGRAKGQPIVGASMQDLEYYRAGALKSIADPAKSRWHEKERALLAAIDAELHRQGVGVPVAHGGAGGSDLPSDLDDGVPF